MFGAATFDSSSAGLAYAPIEDLLFFVDLLFASPALQDRFAVRNLMSLSEGHAKSALVVAVRRSAQSAQEFRALSRWNVIIDGFQHHRTSLLR